jgi:hypothetical protein
MVQGHVAGIMCRDDQYWCDCRWTLTDKGRRGTMAQLERVILRDPPLHVAEQDAAEVADDIANVASGDEPDQRRRILTHLDQLAERICEKMACRAIKEQAMSRRP